MAERGTPVTPDLIKLIDTSLLKVFGELTIVPMKGTIGTLARAMDALTDAEVHSEAGANGLRYYNDNLQYANYSYNAVTPVGTENPSEEGWYVLVDQEYVPTTDTEVQSGTTYYARSTSWVTIETGGGGGVSIVTVPTVDIDTYIYTGSAQGPDITYDSSHCTITGDATATNVGTYTFTISLNDPTKMVWSDLTVAPKTYSYEIEPAIQIYGVEWDGTSTTAWSRTDAAANFTNPTPAVNNGNGSSPFDTILPWSGMVKENDSSAGVLVKIPKYYYKWTRSGSRMKLQISEAYFDGALVSPAHADRGDGVGERDYVYVGRYHCADSDYKSKTGVQPKASITRDAARTAIHNLGSTIWQYDFAMYWTIMLLYLVEYADWNSQAVIGYGCSPSSAKANMGGTDGMIYHTGTSAVNRTTYGWTQYRWIEGLWDNVYDWCDGIYFSGTDVYCIKKPASFSDTSGGTKVGVRTDASGYIKAWTNPTASGFEYALYPNSVDSGLDGSTYIGDYCYYNASGVVLRVGGFYVQNQNYGAFCLVGYVAASYSYAGIGARLQKLPSAA